METVEEGTITPEFFKNQGFRKGITIFLITYNGRKVIGIYDELIVRSPRQSENNYVHITDSGGGVEINLGKITAIREIPLEDVVTALNEMLRFNMLAKLIQ